MLVWQLIVRADLQADDWRGFLGNQGNPAASQQTPPEKFSGKSNEHIAWRTSLVGRSVSGPIVVGDRVFTTSSSGMEGRWMHLFALEAETGEVIWQRSTKATGRPYCHPTSANAAPTPCSDGQRVFAFFSSNDLICYDLDGNIQWYRSLVADHPLAGNDVGMSSSPLVVDGAVVVSVECQTDAFTAAYDAITGERLWEYVRPRKANWASPRTAKCSDGRNIVIVHGLDNCVALDPKSGSELWRLDVPCSSVASATSTAGNLYLPARGLKVFQLASANTVPTLNWETARLNPSSSSLVVTPFGVVGLNRSVLVCCADGELKWQARLPDAGQFWATPVVAGNTLYAFAMNGKCFVVKLSEEAGELIGEYELGDEVLGTPAVADNALYVRATNSLWKIQ